MSPQDSSPDPVSLLDSFRQAVAEDMRLLALLHDREPERETLEALRAVPMEQQLGLRLRSELGRDAARLLDEALRNLPTPIDEAVLEALAADYADVYLTHAYRASPCESVWLDDDGLERQEPMFRVRDWYRTYGLAIADANKRPDDHLVFQFRFVAHLLDTGTGREGLREVARFMDRHLLRWLGQFCGRVASRCPSGYFVGLMLLSAAYGEEKRDLIAEILGEPRPKPEDTPRRAEPPHSEPASEQSYTPGAAPGW